MFGRDDARVALRSGMDISKNPDGVGRQDFCLYHVLSLFGIFVLFAFRAVCRLFRFRRMADDAHPFNPALLHL